MANFLLCFFTLIQAICVYFSYGNPDNLPDPQLLFESYFSQLPGILKIGYPDSGIEPVDPWLPNRKISAEINIGSSDDLVFEFVNSSFVGFSKYNVTGFKVHTDIKTGELYADFFPAIKHFTFESDFVGQGQVSGESQNFSGKFSLYGISYLRNIEYGLLVADDAYFISSTASSYDFKYDSHYTTISFDEASPRSVVELITYHLYVFVRQLSLVLHSEYQGAETDIGKELLKRLQSNSTLI